VRWYSAELASFNRLYVSTASRWITPAMAFTVLAELTHSESSARSDSRFEGARLPLSVSGRRR